MYDFTQQAMSLIILLGIVFSYTAAFIGSPCDCEIFHAVGSCAEEQHLGGGGMTNHAELLVVFQVVTRRLLERRDAGRE